MPPAAPGPTFDGEGSLFADSEQRVRLWPQAADVEPSGRASSLILRMNTIARLVCLNACGGALMQGEDAGSVSNVSREYARADALGHFYRQAAESLQNDRTNETMERRMLEVDIFR